MKNILFGFTLSVLIFFCANTFSATTTESVSKYRTAHQYSVNFGLMGDPFPNPFGVGLSYNILDFARFSLMYGPGFVSNSPDVHSIGTGAVFYLPGRDFTPTWGIHWATIINGSNKNFGQNGKHLYFSVGLDWQLSSEINVAVGYNVPVWIGAGGLPYLQAGWFL